MAKAQVARRLCEAFKDYDLDNSGKVAPEVLQNVLRVLNPRGWNLSVTKRLVKAYQGSRNGAIQYLEFFAWLAGEKPDTVRQPGQLNDVYTMDEESVGKGAFGTVRRGVNKHSGVVRAVKSIKKLPSKNHREIIQTEIDVLKRLDHPNIIRLHEVYEDSEAVHLITDFCEGGDLLHRLIEAGTKLDEKCAAAIMRAALSSLKYMHAAGVVHRDLKLENFLFVEKAKPIEESEIKLIDFGFASTFERDVPMTSKVGTPNYLAPEVSAGSYSEACDAWSAGVVLYILLSGTPPFVGTPGPDLQAKVATGEFSYPDDPWAKITDSAKDLINSLIELDTSKRLTAEQALAHPWLAQEATTDAAPKEEEEAA